MNKLKKDSKTNTEKKENLDLRDPKQREKFIKRVNKELKAANNNYEVIMERRKALEKLEAKLKEREARSWEAIRSMSEDEDIER